MAAIIKTENKYWKGCRKIEPLCTAGRNVKLCSHYGKQYGVSTKKLKIELPYDTAIPLLGIYPKEFIFFIFFIFFYFLFLARQHSMWDLHSLTRDITHAPTVKVWCLNHWTAWEVPPKKS